jgi:uncharacterized membrane protein
MSEDKRHKGSKDRKKKTVGSRDPIWSYRGHDLGSGEFTTAMVHLFRAEINRANVWRTRLDSTTNWAIVTTAAAVSFGFSEAQGNHIVLLLGSMLVAILLSIESRRYRYYELWSSRVRLMETDFFATMLVPPFHPSSDWGESLAENLLQPHYTVSIFEALGRRLRRNYIWIFMVLLLAWLAKLWLHPQPTPHVGEFVGRAAIAFIPGGLVMLGYCAFFLFLLIFALGTARLQQATGEVLPAWSEQPVREEGAEAPAGGKTKEPKETAWFRRSRRRAQYLCLIITDKAQDVSNAILADMHRGVTALQGVGMYSGKEHEVLMSALTVTEVPQLKSIVAGIDPSAFVVVSPAQEILGRGFLAFET